MTDAPDPRLAAFDYDLPDALVARHPAARRASARLLHVGVRPHDHTVSDLPRLLRPGDLLVVNDTRVLPARLHARRASGGAVELLLEGADGPWVEGLARPARRLKLGERLQVVHPTTRVSLEGLSVEVGERTGEGTLRLRPRPSPMAVMEAAGQLPIPPYLGRAEEPSDRDRYQTVFARAPGAVAAPTAGLHLTEPLFAQLASAGIERASVTLHVGAGTFRNLRPSDLDRGSLHPERWVIPPETEAAISRCRERRGRVVAVGTTSTRTLESAAAPGGRVTAGQGETRLFIRPGYRFAVVDALLTNFHLPRSSLLMLVGAFAGVDRVMAAYRHAVAGGYRFYSYGDAMLVEAARGRTD